MVLSEHGDTRYRARVAARFLQTVGRTDVTVGLGIATPHLLQNDWFPQGALVRDYDLESSPGTVVTDGVGALVDQVMGSSEPITIIAIGPLTNIAAALERQTGDRLEGTVRGNGREYTGTVCHGDEGRCG